MARLSSSITFKTPGAILSRHPFSWFIPTRSCCGVMGMAVFLAVDSPEVVAVESRSGPGRPVTREVTAKPSTTWIVGPSPLSPYYNIPSSSYNSSGRLRSRTNPSIPPTRNSITS
ncbi:hypothetical protein PGT21_022058 [Puccinia graminis f. sp. tritici]|uniref:Uncharacterized protein n=1 Tax=Puccinia graminis f. sp. tritici TaxID=56615 RepID=A0A5B0R1T8_PUCGR|nr:hypothetical protein PGT21_022058 [Puccinia graminis f. sp. tritici]